VVRVPRSDVIRVLPIEDSRWKQINGSVDIGFTFTSANSERQASLGANASYLGEKNSVAFSASSNLSRQTSGSNTSRYSVAGDYSRRLSDKWSATVLTSLLSSTQQELDLRTSLGGGLGRFLIRTANTRSILSGGIVASREKYFPQVVGATHTTAEAWMGLAYTHFRFKVFDLNSRLLVYKSLSTGGRVRLGSESTLTWEFIKNVTSNLRIYEDYDSKPPISAPKNDFGVTTSLGWKF
jgi:putative salt-induced outer membrane protein YdiY